MTEKKSAFTTRYDSPEAGTLAFERNAAVEGDILACLEIVRQIRQDFKGQAEIVAGLEGIASQLQGLRASSEPEPKIRAQLEQLMRVPLPGDRSLRLEAFRKTSAKGSVASEEAYLEQVEKIVRNTCNNLALLLLNTPDDTILARLMDELAALPLSEYREVRARMAQLSKSPQFWHYNERKKSFLIEWLMPFQADLGKPIAEMSEEEFEAALHKVEKLRETRLEEMTHLMVESDRAPFRVYNRAMNPHINGKEESFWGGGEVRDEFLALINKLITRFSFRLEDRYLVFRTKDGGFCYLAGFADEAFDRAITTKDGKLGLYPHLKVFLRTGEDDYAEITQEFYSRNPKAYYSNLRTAVMPFLRAAAVMVEAELSPALKGAFDMWG